MDTLQQDQLLKAVEGIDLSSLDGRVGISVLIAEIDRMDPNAIRAAAARKDIEAIERGVGR